MTVRQVEPLPAARALTTLSEVDYEDAFLVEIGPADERTPEQWARTILDGAPIALRSALWSAWVAFGLRLGSPRSAEFILGWEVRRSTPDFVLLGADSRLGMPAELLVKRQQDTLLFATLVQKKNPIARAMWAGIEPGHRPVVRYVLEHAAQQMRLPKSAHTSRPWRIHELAPDFRLEDVWALPAVGGRDDFPRLVEMMATTDPERGSSVAVRALFELRWKIGDLFGWDREETGIGARVSTLRDRLPEDLRAAPTGPDFDALPFSPLYLTDDEWAAEVGNGTMHGVMHLGWVPDGTGRFRGQMAVLVNPNGRFGTAYMAAIKPFRYLIVYPAMLRESGQRWREVART